MLSRKNVLSIRQQLRKKPTQNYYIQEHGNKLYVIDGFGLPTNADSSAFSSYITQSKLEKKQFAQFYNRDKSTYLITPVKEYANITSFAKKAY